MSVLAALPSQEWLDNPVIREIVPTAVLETLAMTAVAGVITALLGIPLGVLLFTTSPDGTAPNPAAHRIVGAVVNLGRSLPFLILMIAIIPVTRLIVGTSIGWQAAVVPLTVGAIPFYARLVETSLREVPSGKVEAVTMMGATRREITRKVLLPEARSGLVAGLTTTLIGYTAMADAVGGGGLGAVAMSYGYNRFETDVMVVCVALLVLIVTAVQVIGDLVARRLDRR